MPLTRNRIISAAMELIERDGADALSMGRLATQLGCGVMSLYSCVPSKAALLDGVADAVMSGIECAPRPEASWQEQVRGQARAFREIARAHPRCTMIMVGRPVASTVPLRPVEHALATLREAGFGGPDSIRIVRAFAAYILGSLLREFGAAPGLTDPDLGASADGGHRPRIRAEEFPQVTSLAAELRDEDPDADFEFGLELLVRASAALLHADASC